MGWLIWIGAALLLGIVELATVDLFFLTLALAALAAGGAGAVGGSFWIQLGVFVGVSILLLAFVRPWARNLLQKSTPNIATNAQGLVGKRAVVTAPLVGSEGRVRLEGGIWSARSLDGRVFPVGSQVTVVGIEGATAVVGPSDEPVRTPPDREPPND